MMERFVEDDKFSDAYYAGVTDEIGKLSRDPEFYDNLNESISKHFESKFIERVDFM
jgi:hypothetical protein